MTRGTRDADSADLRRPPRRPWAIAAANRVLPTPAIAPDALRSAALKRAGGPTDFGDPTHVEALERLCASIRDEARLTPVGAHIVRGRLVGTLTNRLHIEAIHAADPSLGRRAVARPIIVTGLQRTGTTMLHRLLAAHPDLAALRAWQTLNPVPRHADAARDRAERIRAAELAVRGLRWMAPAFFAIHPIEAESPEEEVVLLDHALMSTVPEATMRVPSFSAWLEAQHHAPAYAYLKRMLQVIAADADTRWVLKTPHHLEHLDVLLDTFPDAVVVWCHRDPVQTVASLASMIGHGVAVFSDHVDPAELGAHWLRKCARMVDHARAVRARRPDAAVIDVDYAELMRDPWAQVARILDAAGLDAGADAESAVRHAHAGAPAHRYGRHAYRLSDFDLTEGRVAAAFAGYRAERGWG